MKFLNPDVDAQYECLVEVDRLVHKLGLYSGPLSKITLPMAEYMTKKESVLIKRKDGVEKQAAPSNPKPVVKKPEAQKTEE